jgi:hypothetical protein
MNRPAPKIGKPAARSGGSFSRPHPFPWASCYTGSEAGVGRAGDSVSEGPNPAWRKPFGFFQLGRFDSSRGWCWEAL